MSAFFLKIVNMSISASWLVLAVLLLRLVLKKAPKWVSVLLWGLVAIRLLCPVSIESMLSLIPSAETIRPDIMLDPTPELHTGIQSINSAINPIVTQSFAPNPGTSMNPLQLWIPLAAIGWLAGMGAMLIYTAVSYILLRRKVATAVLLRENIYQSEHVDSPFVLGVIKPKIYLPFRMDGQSLEHVIAHEQAHIRRKDHWWKPVGFLLLTVYWLNPLMWLGYILLCRDIELACDEKVIKSLDSEERADYTQALVACSVRRHSIAACPLAFGEVGVKERVKSVMHYKKPAFWIVLGAVIVCVAVAVCFLTDPVHTPDTVSIVDTVTTNLKTYHALSDGTWQADGRNYKYRLEKSGRMPNAAVDFTFVYLSNLETITFEQAWKAAGFSSHTDDYFAPEEAVLVEWIGDEDPLNSTVKKENGKLLPQEGSWLDMAISDAILERNLQEVTPGNVATENHIILARDAVSATPAAGQTEHVREETVFVYYLFSKFLEYDTQMVSKLDRYGCAIITFSVPEMNKYVLKEYRQPEMSADYQPLLLEKYAAATETLAENQEQYQKQLLDGCLESAEKYLAQKKGETVERSETEQQIYGTCQTWTGWTGAPAFYMGAVNGENLSTNSVNHLPVYKLDRKWELDSFCNQAAQYVSVNETRGDLPSFGEIAEGYGEGYFEANSLILVYVTAPNDTYRYHLTQAYREGPTLRFEIDEVFGAGPEAPEQAGWLLVIEVSKELTQSCTAFDAVLAAR